MSKHETSSDQDPRREQRWPLHDTNVGTGLPLEGIRILDFSRVLAGPLCAMVAGDLGADVIKIEAPTGDPVRSLAPPRFGDDATYYLAVNRHRRNITLDLRDPNEYAVAEELISVADAVVENFLPSQKASLRIEELRAAHPDVVWVSVSSASSGGPLADEPAFDLLAQARSGLMGVTGDAGGEPLKVGAPIADVVTGLYAAVGLLAGLFARATQRPGRHFEAPLLESALSALMNQAQGYLVTGVAPQRLGNDHPSITPYGPVRTRDGFLLLAVGTDGQFARLVDVMNDDVIRSRQEWMTNDGRVLDRDVVRSELDRVFGRATTDEWVARLAGTGVPYAPVLDVAGALAQPQVAGGDLVGETDAPAGSLRMIRSPLLIDGARPPLRRGPRRLGDDNDQIRRT